MKIFISSPFRVLGQIADPVSGTVVTKDIDGTVISNGVAATDIGNGQLKYEEENNEAVVAIFTATGDYDENQIPDVKVIFVADTATFEAGDYLVALADYKSFLQLSGSAYDSLLSLFRAEIEGKILSRLRRDIFDDTYTEELYDGSGTNFLILNQFPINSVTKIEEYQGLDENDVEDWDELTVANGDFARKIIIDEIKLYLDGRRFAKGVQNYRITYTAGYATIPPEIQLVCKKLFALYYYDYQGRLGKVSDSLNSSGGTGNTTFDAQAEEKLLKELDGYGKVNF